MKAVFLRELRSQFCGITAYLYGAFILLFVGIYTMVINLNAGYAEFEIVLESMAFIYLLASPLLTMRSLAEEKHSKTDQLLYSLPIRLSGVVTAKFLAMAVVSLVPCLVMCLYPLLLSAFGSINFRAAYTAILMFFLLGACLISVGMFISSLCENQLVSAVITLAAMLLIFFLSSLSSYVSESEDANFLMLCILCAVVCGAIYFFTKNKLATFGSLVLMLGILVAIWFIDNSFYSALIPNCMNALALFERFYDTLNGLFDARSIIYDFTVTGVFLFLTTQSMERRRWL